MRACFCNIKGDSGPGYPWVRLGSTKGDVLARHGELVIDSVLLLIRLWSLFDGSNFPDEPSELVKMGVSAPFRVFIKNEPHKLAKRETGRLRIIVSVPLHIVLAQMLIYGPQDNAEIDHWSTIPSKPGMGLSLDEHIKLHWDRVMGELRGKVASSDKKSFDFSVSAYCMELDTERRIYLCGADPDGLCARVMRAETWVMNRAVFATSDGQFYEQMIPGGQKSGSKKTASTNSAINTGLASAIGANFCDSYGDDGAEEPIEGAVEKYLAYGFIVEPYEIWDEGFEFCSHTFRDGIAWPTTPGKMIYNLLNVKPKDVAEKHAYWNAFCFELRHHPDLESVIIPLIEGSKWAAQIE